MPEQVRLGDPRFALPVLAVIGVSAALIAAARRWPAGLAAWSHSAIAVAPVSGVVQAGAQLAHDRFAYCPASASRCSPAPPSRGSSGVGGRGR